MCTVEGRVGEAELCAPFRAQEIVNESQSYLYRWTFCLAVIGFNCALVLPC